MIVLTSTLHLLPTPPAAAVSRGVTGRGVLCRRSEGQGGHRGSHVAEPPPAGAGRAHQLPRPRLPGRPCFRHPGVRRWCRHDLPLLGCLPIPALTCPTCLTPNCLHSPVLLFIAIVAQRNTMCQVVSCPVIALTSTMTQGLSNDHYLMHVILRSCGAACACTCQCLAAFTFAASLHLHPFPASVVASGAFEQLRWTM